MSNHDYLDDYILDCEVRGLSRETIRSARSNLRTLAKFLDKQNIDFKEADNEALKKILLYLRNTRKVGWKTQKHYFSDLSSFYEYKTYHDSSWSNPVPGFRKRYLNTYKNGSTSAQRKLLTVEQMGTLINSTLGIRDKAMMTVFAKTGVRRGELIQMDLGDVDFTLNRIKLKESIAKRSNLYVYFDEECAVLLGRWLRVRHQYANPDEVTLFVGDLGARISRNMVYRIVTDNAKRLGYYDGESDSLEDHFSPHCFRHWFTTYLRRNGLSREYIKELRGDSRREAVDIYDHIDHGELRKAYLAAMPRLGII